jgi:hypothetical protein
MAKQLNMGDLFPEYTVTDASSAAGSVRGILGADLLPRQLVTLLHSAVGRLPVTHRGVQEGECRHRGPFRGPAR